MSSTKDRFECEFLGFGFFTEVSPPKHDGNEYIDPLIEAQFKAFESGVKSEMTGAKERIFERRNDLDEQTYDFDANAEDEAKKRGQIVVYPEPNQLQLDIDSEEALELFHHHLQAFSLDGFNDGCDFRSQCKIMQTTSRKPGHYHIYITVKDRVFTELERIAIQQALGSDPVREFLNLLRWFAGNEKPTRLFERPDFKS